MSLISARPIGRVGGVQALLRLYNANPALVV